MYPLGHLSTQSSLSSLPTEDKVPAGQSLQLDSDVAPGVFEYLPAAQSIQKLSELLPAIGEYFPLGHCLQKFTEFAASVGEYLPALQSPQTTSLVAPSETCVEYLPAAQGIQSSWRTPNVSRYLPLGQSSQSDSAVWPGFDEYVPAGQSVHTEEPWPEYFPD